jgi:hypothetical protein
MNVYVPFRTRACIVCGKSSTIELEKSRFDRWQAGEYVQNVWPELDADARERLITGTHSECWNEMFGEEE